jgi:ADP-ribose pyrophosphatase YjhB (NUDIX family)
MASLVNTEIQTESPPLILKQPEYGVPVAFSAFAIVIDVHGHMVSFVDNNPKSTITLRRYKFPGGGVQETDENFFAAAYRETVEETGLEIGAISVFPFIAEVKNFTEDGTLKSADYKVFIPAIEVGGELKSEAGKNYERLGYTSTGRLAGSTSKGCAMQEWQLSALIWAKQQRLHENWRRQVPPVMSFTLTPQQLLTRNLMPNQVFERYNVRDKRKTA